jgi:hypothetical protein
MKNEGQTEGEKEARKKEAQVLLMPHHVTATCRSAEPVLTRANKLRLQPFSFRLWTRAKQTETVYKQFINGIFLGSLLSPV